MSITPFLLKAKHWLIHGGSFQLRTYEVACLQAWKSVLPDEAIALLDEQLKRLTFFQRQGNEKLLCFYDMTDKAAVHWPKEILFPCQLEEISVARLHLRPVGVGAIEFIKVDVTLCCGRFFGFEFSKPPKSLRNGADVLKADMLVNPMTPTTGDSVMPDQRERVIASIDAKLPAEYLHMVADGGVMVRGWDILDVARVRKLVQMDRNYYLLAEKKGCGAIGVATGEQSGQLYYLDYENDIPVSIQTSLQAFIDHIDGAH